MDNVGQRQRSRCVITNDNKKNSVLNETEKMKENKEKETQKNVTSSFIRLDSKDIRKQRESLLTTEFKTNFNKPKFSGVKKEFYSKNPKNIFFHEKGTVVSDFDKNNFEEIEANCQKMDLKTFFSYYSEKDFEKLELNNLLDIDYEKLEELKCKAKEFIDATSVLIAEKKAENKNTEEEEQLSIFFIKKLEEILENKLNIHTFVNNIEKVSSLSYSNNGIKVNFKKKK